MRHNPRKRFGQNFLIDRHVIADIIDEIHPGKDDNMVEIGPGLGALTKPLLQIVDHLNVVELDRDIVARLQQEFSSEKLTIFSSDALKFDFSSLGQKLRIVGNLPYNISTPLLFHLKQYTQNIIDMHFMLQKEVVERMVASPSSSSYGRLSVMLQYCFDMQLVLKVPAEAFHPAPKVESAIVYMVPLQQPRLMAEDEILFSQIVTAAFSQRRKTLRNTLGAFLNPDTFKALAIDPKLRAENLTVMQYINITNYLSQQK